MPTALRLNMTGHSDDPTLESGRYRAAIEMAGFAEKHGFAVVSVEEHHVAENGWLPSPLTLAAAIIGRTETIAVNCTALLITLYDPIRLAEDIAVLDLCSGGRFSFVAGIGYRPVEYAALDKDWDARGKQMDHTIETLLKAWSGDTFEYNGQMIRVTPVPVSKPYPPFAIGGMSKPAVRRAARFGLPLYLPMEMPELSDLYRSELARLGMKGIVAHPAEENSMIFIDEDPERAWQELAPYFLREGREYSDWKRAGVPRPGEEPVSGVDGLRSQKRYEILTPSECIARIEEHGPEFTPCLHPLCGGIPVERAWQGLELYVNEVLPAIGGA